MRLHEISFNETKDIYYSWEFHNWFNSSTINKYSVDLKKLLVDPLINHRRIVKSAQYHISNYLPKKFMLLHGRLLENEIWVEAELICVGEVGVALSHGSVLPYTKDSALILKLEEPLASKLLELALKQLKKTELTPWRIKYL